MASVRLVRRVVMVMRRRVVRVRSTGIVRHVVRVAKVSVARGRASRRTVMLRVAGAMAGETVVVARL
jgi:hypothetical protein